MRLRIASVAFLVGTLATGLAWLTVQPLLLWLIGLAKRSLSPDTAAEFGARLHRVLLMDIGLDLALAGVGTFAILYLALERPLRSTERVVERLGRLELEPALEPRGGPLLSRLQAAILRAGTALSHERELTRRQVGELKATNDRLTRVQAELLASERLATVGRLAAGIAHEIGNPLSGVMGYLSLARKKAEGEELQEYLARIEGEVQRIDQIVSGLLDLGRPSRGAAVPVDVEHIARTCAGLIAAGPDSRGVSIELKFEPGTVARAESGPLSQVLLNLLLNAAEASHGDGRICVRGRCEDARVRVEVEDSGPGIPPAVMERLFEPFFTTKSETHGTGLGLAVSRHLATQMGGELRAANGPGGGALFTLTLPRA